MFVGLIRIIPISIIHYIIFTLKICAFSDTIYFSWQNRLQNLKPILFFQYTDFIKVKTQHIEVCS